jgi:phosphatidylserine/phosphatidylglycerophosphate/cardiolipin synthase-like enzyme
VHKDRIVTPIATSETLSCTLTLPWFVQGTEYCPDAATFQPLVNGEEAFGAVYDAILAAEHTIEIVCWGFQPSMHFKRGGEKTLPIGALLRQKDAEGVKVRILCWTDSLRLAQWSENMTPGRNLAGHFKLQNRTDEQSEEDRHWYLQASRRRVSPDEYSHSDSHLAESLAVKRGLSAEGFQHLEFCTRDFGIRDRWEIFWQQQIATPEREDYLNSLVPPLAMATEPSHHQKSVLVDYEHPDKAVGFVMGHNMLDAYWDTSAHGYERQEPHLGRNGQTPRQDISCRVTGKPLAHINANFCEAWEKEAGEDLLPARAEIYHQLHPRPALGNKVMAQILRTQVEGREPVNDIKAMYLKAVNNVTSFIYIENQYFRWSTLADKIKEAAQNQIRHGRDPGEHGSIYLFVVTNATDEGVGLGTVKTYHMLDSLGRPDLMPNVAKRVKDDALDEEHDAALKALIHRKQRYDELSRTDASDKPGFSIAELKTATEQYEEAKKVYALHAQNREKLREKPIIPSEIPGLKMHICTLVAPDSPGHNWLDVYIHSKLMIVNDCFTTLGSANINSRSMEVDSELNICHEMGSVTKPLRQKLWGIHTNGMGAQDDPAEAFIEWGRIINENNDRKKTNKETQFNGQKLEPHASLIEFFRESPSMTNVD